MARRLVPARPERHHVAHHGRPARDPVSRLLRVTTMSRQIGILTLRQFAIARSIFIPRCRSAGEGFTEHAQNWT